MGDITKHPYPPCYNGRLCDSRECCFVRVEWPELVGQNGEKAKAVIEKDNAYVTAILIPVGKAIGFTDFCCNRVYVWIDEKGNVFQMPLVA
ncbi:hypothetical protein ACJRO7_025961 [Eucalyptus globulus]|uniref:Uncharacterized protein n=1 Tax=Eucalyptus globulus TaxID=34317 RepID=A0ABD3KGS8_EUCGL